MGRKKGDGRGRLGGRVKGTPNKDKPLKVFLREHSLEYFTPNIEETKNGKATGRLLSQFDIDTAELDPKDRVDAEIKLLKYHTPQQQSTSVDIVTESGNESLVDKLIRISRENEK